MWDPHHKFMSLFRGLQNGHTENPLEIALRNMLLDTHLARHKPRIEAEESRRSAPWFAAPAPRRTLSQSAIEMSIVCSTLRCEMRQTMCGTRHSRQTSHKFKLFASPPSHSSFGAHLTNSTKSFVACDRAYASWAFECLVARAWFRRQPHAGQSTYCIMLVQVHTETAQRADISLDLMMKKVRAFVVEHHVDPVHFAVQHDQMLSGSRPLTKTAILKRGVTWYMPEPNAPARPKVAVRCSVAAQSGLAKVVGDVPSFDSWWSILHQPRYASKPSKVEFPSFPARKIKLMKPTVFTAVTLIPNAVCEQGLVFQMCGTDLFLSFLKKDF